MDVAHLHLPDDEARRRSLAQIGAPRLLLVGDDAPPPEIIDELEDWVRLPARHDDLVARSRVLAARAGRDGRLDVDADGVVRVGARQAVLPPIEARLAAELVARRDSVVARDALMRAGWPDGAGTRNLLDVRILRLRRRLVEVGLEVRTVRHRGYLLTVADAAIAAAPAKDLGQLADSDV